jgi:hypothetical protein
MVKYEPYCIENATTNMPGNAAILSHTLTGSDDQAD